VPKRRVTIVLDTRGGADVEADFKRLYGGSDANWRWLKRKLDAMDPAVLKARCVRIVRGRQPCDLLKLPPCFVFGKLVVNNEAAWSEGLEEGVFTIEAVVHDDYAQAYYRERIERVPEEDQNE
jgi:hypothetical protein